MDESRRDKRRRRRRIVNSTAVAIALVIGSLTTAPELLAWPYMAERGNVRIYSESPIPPEIDAVLARADRLLAQSPVHDPAASRRLFLSDGGWRWNLVALTSRGAFALRRPFRSAILLNRSDVAHDRIMNGPGAVRTLSGVIAHEVTHIDVAQRIGEVRAAMLPTWKSEGYADHVAQESSLTADQAAQLRASGADHPALVYFEGRQRVAAALRANGGNVEALMRGD